MTPTTDGDPTPQLLGLAERLYGLPLAEFTPSRDALVKQHKGTELAPLLKSSVPPCARRRPRCRPTS